MATIYRFIVEQKYHQPASATGRQVKEQSITKSVGKQGRMVSLFGGEKGGVEHNRKMRAINPILNRATGGAWEKGMRIGRAGAGLIKVDNNGKMGISGPAIAIIVAFVIQLLMKYLSKEQQKAAKLNAQNYKQLENGIGAINGPYQVSTTKTVRGWWTGLHTYNQNK